MAYRLGTMFAQLGGYVGSVERIGAHWFAAGMNTTLRNPKEASAFALDRSLELKSRFDTLDRDIRENVRRFAGKTDLASMVQRYRFTGISFFDRLVVIPTWIGAYNKAIAAGMDEDQAVHEADSAVRESQGAGAAKDLAAIQRGSGPAGEMGKSLTMFYSFQFANYQRFLELAWDAGEAVRSRNGRWCRNWRCAACCWLSLLLSCLRCCQGKGLTMTTRKVGPNGRPRLRCMVWRLLSRWRAISCLWSAANSQAIGLTAIASRESKASGNRLSVSLVTFERPLRAGKPRGQPVTLWKLLAT